MHWWGTPGIKDNFCTFSYFRSDTDKKNIIKSSEREKDNPSYNHYINFHISGVDKVVVNVFLNFYFLFGLSNSCKV